MSGGTLAQWAAERLQIDPDSSEPGQALRGDYLMWVSDHGRGHRPEPAPRMRNILRALGARPRGTREALRYEGLRLLPLPDSGYRVGGAQSAPCAPEDVLGALAALRNAGIVTDRTNLNRAWKELL